MKHTHKCRYMDNDKLQYALLEIGKDRKILIAAEEYPLFEKYLECARNKDKGVVLNLEQPEKEPLQLVYGGMLLNVGIAYPQAEKYAGEIAGYALLDLEEEKVNVSCYQDIKLFPQETRLGNYIPFVALMQTTHRLKNRISSVSMFPSMDGHPVWEAMANRPFVLACRESVLQEGITKENWKGYIDIDRMLEVYQVADLIIE